MTRKTSSLSTELAACLPHWTW